MIGRFVLSPLAQADLDEIFDYSYENWGLTRAETYMSEIEAKVFLIASSPGLGQACQDIRPGYYRMPAGSHIIFYQCTDDGIDIKRVLHQAMDFNRHL